MENKIEFDLELYNSGEYDVVTRSGKPVKIAGVNEEAHAHHQVSGWSNGYSYGWSLTGQFTGEGYKSDNDLFLTPKKKIIKGWTNVYSNVTYLLCLYETKEEAIERQGKDAIGVVYIETELIPNK